MTDNKRALAFMARPDDVEFTTAGTLALFAPERLGDNTSSRKSSGCPRQPARLAVESSTASDEYIHGAWLALGENAGSSVGVK